MARFLIEVPHSEEIVACARVVQVFLHTGSHYLTHADWGCSDCDHRSWMIVDAEDKVRYFSGSAVYSTRFTVPTELQAKDRRVYLDLGEVQVMARVKLNGQDLGPLWKPPYQIDVTKACKPGENKLEVRVVNLWPNRLIGDEQLPEDSERNKDGTLKAWPQWLQDGKPSPTGRSTFVSWRLWKKQDALLRSGLIGPVRLRCAELCELK